MGIRAEAQSSHFDSYPVEEDLAQRFDEGFDITFGRPFGQLSMWLADPKPHIRERFGFAKEILVIYSRHAKTDARVLSAIENITRNPEFRHRLDRAIVFLVHAGQPDQVANLLKDRLDWIVVPFTTTEITDPHRGPLFLRSRIAASIGNLDLFGMSSPITDDRYFFGRSDLVQQMITRLVERHENTGLFGLRKTGKTSVMFAIQRRLADRAVLVEYLDCQNPGIHAARWWQVLEGIVNRCKCTARTTKGRTTEQSSDYTEHNAGMRFLDDLRVLMTECSYDHLVLMFDEIEYITPNISGALGRHWDSDFISFWQTIRAVHQELQGRLSFCVAGVNPASVTTSHFGVAPNPIFQLAAPTYLDPLDPPKVREMVRTIGRYSGLDIDEPVHAYLSTAYGGHPFLVRIACSEVWRTCDTTDPDRRERVTVEHFRRISSDIRARLEQPVRDILLSLVWWYPEEYDVLRILADGDESFVGEYLKDRQSSILQFARYGLLTPDGRQFAIADLKEFLMRNGEEYKRQLSPFMRGDLPPTLLPEIPNLDLLGELFRKRTEVETKLRRVILMYLGVKYTWDDTKIAQAIAVGLKKRKDRPDPAQLFVGRRPRDVMNELFTLDLKEIVLAHWEIFGSLFGGNKTRCEMNFDTLNKARRVDAHSKPIPPAEIEDIQNSYGWMLAKLNAVGGLESEGQ